MVCFGVVSLSTGRLVQTFCGMFNAEIFAVFLRRLVHHRRRGKEMIVVLDNARYHTHACWRRCRSNTAASSSFCSCRLTTPSSLPSNAFGTLTRRLAMHNRYFATLEDVLDAANACFRPWQRLNDVLRRIC